MISFFPKSISNKGIALYIASLAIVSILYFSYAIPFEFMIFGFVEVITFFVLSTLYSKKWKELPDKKFEKNVFLTALGMRVLWVIFSYFYYKIKTGIPFEFNPGDALYYYEESNWLRHENLATIWYYMVTIQQTVSDSGYLIYLGIIQKIVGYNIITVRLVKAILSAFTCILLYRLTKRTLGEKVGRLACVFSVFMPNLIIYCGMHLKETEMVFLLIAFLERSDNLIRNKKYSFGTIILPLLLGISLFFFRTALGAVAVLSLITALLFLPGQKINKGRKAITLIWVAVAIGILAGGTIANEVEGIWQDRSSNQASKREQQISRGNLWVQYATGTVMAPMAFVLPFATMVDTGGQYNQILIHGGCYVRNFMGIFVMLALFYAIFKKKTWRDFALIGSFTVGYMIVVALSSFSSSERFLLPSLPGLTVFWAYGVSQLNAKNIQIVKWWYILVPIMEIGWAYFKLGNKGLL
ncbi:MAG: glycosyltransferase family 39 protein [Candidatus Saccharibacteria bacterium]|nr:glycosyltransferase family 39 protein [Candidatus Saccharibacteria bacterium]